VPHAVAVNNGTTALITALKMSGMPQGSEVVIPPFTFVATSNAALEAGYKVRFGDIDPLRSTPQQTLF
jgi:dTDP-4-amino-4,6-dideoxygalactose transaminase